MWFTLNTVKISCFNIKLGVPLSRLLIKIFNYNFQIEMPGQNESSPSHSPIYSHYIGSSPSSFSLQVNEAELYHAMTAAEHSL